MWLLIPSRDYKHPIVWFIIVFFIVTITRNSLCYKRPWAVEQRLKKSFLCKASLHEYNYRCSNLSNCLMLDKHYYTCRDRNIFNVSGLPKNISTMLLKSHEIQQNDTFHLISEDTQSLQVILNTTWTGSYMLDEKVWFDLRSIKRLNNLVKFVLAQCPRSFYQPIALHFTNNTFRALSKLKILQINIDLAVDLNLAGIVGPLLSLEVLDLSMSKGLSQVVLRNAFHDMNRQHLQHLCLIGFQAMAGMGYNSSWDPKYIFSGPPFLHLRTLDIGSNSLSKIGPGIASLMPSLRSFSVSENMCLNYYSSAAIAEALLHKNLIYIDGSFQLPMQHHNIDYRAESRDVIKKLVDCVNTCSSGNISSVFNQSLTISTDIVICLLPNIFSSLERDLIPHISEVANSNCPYLVQFPLHWEEIYLDSLNWMSSTGSLSLGRSICVRQNNLTVLSVGNNRQIFSSFFLYAINDQKYTSDAIEIFNVGDNGITFNPMFFIDIGKAYPELVYFDVSNNNITFNRSIEICKIIPNVQYMDFSGNYVLYDKHSEVQLLKNCSKLQNAQLSMTGILGIYDFDFNNTWQIKTVNLSQNNLIDANGPIFRKLENIASSRNKTITVDLTGNPLNCNCSSNLIQQLRKLVTGQHLRIANLPGYHCVGATGILNVETLINNSDYFANSRSSCPDIGLLIGIGCSMGVFGSCLIIIVTTLIVKKRWHLKYLLFWLRRKFREPHRPDGRKNHWKYDAFVSYCAEDRFWVHDVLKKTLEEHYHFKLCIHFRDFRVGEEIAKEIVTRMEQSRECIVVMTDYFFASQWCSFEKNHALLLADRRKSKVIIVKLGNISEENLKEARVLDTHNYLECVDDNKAKDLFWAKLIRAMYGEDSEESCSNCCFCRTKLPNTV